MKPIKAAIISIEGKKLTDNECYLIAQEQPLGIALFARNIDTPEQLKQLTHQIKETAESDNILISIDQEGGRVCRLTAPYWRNYMSQASLASLPNDEASSAAILHAELIADDLHAAGINCNFAPTLDVATSNITTALKNRCFSTDEKIVSHLGKCIFDTYSRLGIASCIKHMPGHSGAEVDPHLQLSTIENLNEKYLYPFAQIAPQALIGMTAHIVLKQIDDLPVTMSEKAIKNLIRNHLGFKGLLISDALEMHALSGTLAEKTITSLNAGVDAVCYCKGDINGVQTVLNNCGYLHDGALQTLAKITLLTHSPYKAEDIELKQAKYLEYSQRAIQFPDDYDAVEVLNKL